MLEELDPPLGELNTTLVHWSQMMWSLMPLAGVDSEALFGASLGAWLAYTSRRRLKGWLVGNSRRPLKHWQRVCALMLCAGIGYLFAPLILGLAPFLSKGVAAFVAAVVVIPISLKVILWLDEAQLEDLLEKWRKGG